MAKDTDINRGKYPIWKKVFSLLINICILHIINILYKYIHADTTLEFKKERKENIKNKKINNFFFLFFYTHKTHDVIMITLYDYITSLSQPPEFLIFADNIHSCHP